MRNHLIVVIGILTLGVCLPSKVQANEFGVNLYGYSYYFLKEDQSLDYLNEFNAGLGFRATSGGRKSSQIFLEGGTFEDGIKNQAKYLSLGFLLRVFHQLRIGINAAAYSTETINRGDVIFAPLPIITYSLGPITANGVYLPKFRDLNPFHTLGFYLTIRMFEGKPANKK